MNEDRVVQCLKRQPYVEDVFECGLFCNKTNPCMGVSPDGILVLTPPGAQSQVIASLEIKTRMAPRMVLNATEITKKMGSKYFSCTVGDDVWFTAVPLEHRSQVRRHGI
jgi:hypothetical protein